MEEELNRLREANAGKKTGTWKVEKEAAMQKI